jgi:hypothetical protein
MKKIIAILLLFVPLFVVASEQEVVNGIEEPQWKDFAPKAYENVQEPKGFNKFNDVIAYWYKRKAEFDKGIEKCREVEKTEARVACYQELKVRQYQKNSDYNARIEAMERQRMNPQQMQDATTNMYPIGGFVNTFTKFQPNEFN